MRRQSPIITRQGLLAVIALFMICLSACSGGTEVGNPSVDAIATDFNSDETLEAYLKDQFASDVLPVAAQEKATDVANTPASTTNETFDASEANGNHSGTNLQEAGVDEADLVKTDGAYLYTAGDDEIRIVRTDAAGDLTLVGRIPVKGQVDSFYLYKDLLIVLFIPETGKGTRWTGTTATAVADIGMPYWIPVNARAGILLVDVGNPEKPAPIKTIIADGSLKSSRQIQGKLHVVQQFLPELPTLDLVYDGTDADKAAVIQANQQRLAALTLDDLLPSLTVQDANGNPQATGRLVQTADFFRPETPEGGSIVTVLTVDLDAVGLPIQTMGVVADAHQVYASTKALYVASARWQIQPVWAAIDSQVATQLYKFDLSGDKVRYAASGGITGRILNQFSMGEYQDVLRLATTTGWGSQSQNHVFCMKAYRKKLEIIGRLNNLAPGESLYSARFLGPRGFLVTFVKVDPLFTLDLSDPTAPKVIGYLKVPGYSDYIHPLDADHLLTIGKNTQLENGTAYYQGVQLSIFDISDFSRPRLLHKLEIGDRGTTSEALYNHKAFTYWTANHLLAVPIDLYERSSPPVHAYDYGDWVFSGLYVYRATIENGFEYLGRIDTNPDKDMVYYYMPWTRGIFISEQVYAVDKLAVRSAYWKDIGGGIQILPLGGLIR